MKIARIETFIFGTDSSKDLLLCRVEAEDGTHGWGEAYVTHGREEVIAVLIEKMAAHVIGRSVFQIRHTGQILFDDFAIKRGSMELLSAWSAIEIASWDIIGKIAGLPVYNLLGGASRERVRIYANGWAGRSTIEEGSSAAARSRRWASPPPSSTRSPGRGAAISPAATRISRSTTCGRCVRRWGPISRSWSRRTAA